VYEFRWVRGHVEIFSHGQFQFSADTIEEATRELNSITEEGGTTLCKTIPKVADPVQQ
jgi:hypothetical protein